VEGRRLSLQEVHFPRRLPPPWFSLFALPPQSFYGNEPARGVFPGTLLFLETDFVFLLNFVPITCCARFLASLRVSSCRCLLPPLSQICFALGLTTVCAGLCVPAFPFSKWHGLLSITRSIVAPFPLLRFFGRQAYWPSGSI